MEYVLKYDINSGLWTVLERPAGRTIGRRLANGYKYKAYAERKLAKEGTCTH